MMNKCHVCLTEYDGRVCPERKHCVITRPGYYTLLHKCETPIQRPVDQVFPRMEGTREDRDGAVLQFEETVLSCRDCGAIGVELYSRAGTTGSLCAKCDMGECIECGTALVDGEHRISHMCDECSRPRN